METDNETDTTGDWGLPWNAQCPVHGVARIMHRKYDATNGHGRQLALDFSTVASPNSHSTPLSSILPTPSVGLVGLPLLPLTVLPMRFQHVVAAPQICTTMWHVEACSWSLLSPRQRLASRVGARVFESGLRVSEVVRP